MNVSPLLWPILKNVLKTDKENIAAFFLLAMTFYWTWVKNKLEGVHNLRLAYNHLKHTGFVQHKGKNNGGNISILNI